MNKPAQHYLQLTPVQARLLGQALIDQAARVEAAQKDNRPSAYSYVHSPEDFPNGDRFAVRVGSPA